MIHTIAIGAGLAWASGMRLYAVMFAAGLLASLGVVTLPGDLTVLSHPLVLTASGVMFFIEFFADKIPGVDSLWDAVHTFIRIPAGAILAAASLGVHADPALVLAAGILGGTLASSSHFAKAGSRALINTSPEPFSNWAASFFEDGLTGLMLWLVFSHAWVGLAVLALMLVLSFLLIRGVWRFLAGMFRKLSLPALNPPHFSP
ncbi:MAG TPA: DUF4126 domain-containing protein [Burkholderiales bacterium]